MENGESGRHTPRIRIFLLGGFRVERDGIVIPESAWGRRQAIALVKRLAVEPSHQLHREEVLDLFWPDSSPSAGGANLRKVLHYAREALHGAGVSSREQHAAPRNRQSVIEDRPELRYVDEVVRLDPRHVWIDADAFEGAGREALADGSVRSLEGAAALYGGELLPGERYEDWAEQRRALLAALHLDILLATASAVQHTGRSREAVALLHRVLLADPAHEVAHRELMLHYMHDGNPQQALRQYQLCVDALEEHVGARPSPETEELRGQIASGKLDPAKQGKPRLPSAVRGASATPFVGRERALELIWSGWAGGERGGRVDHRTKITIGGEAGVGKTRLATEAARVASRRGATVLWGSASRLEGRIAYGPLAEALEEHVARLSRAELDTLAADQPELGSMLPSLGFRGPIGDPQTEQMRLFAGVARLLTHIAERHGVLLVIDDLHLADDASLQLLRYLARLGVDRRWRFIGTYREEQLDEETSLRNLIAELQHMGASLHVDLLPLSRRECDRLVEALLAPHGVENEALAHIFALSLGNPLFVIELVESLREAGALTLRNGLWHLDLASAPQLELPRGVTDLITSRMQALEEPLRSLLSFAAVAGMECDPELLVVATEQDEDAVLNMLDRAVTARVLEERERGYAFRHPLFREALYQGLSQRRRIWIHAALGRALESAPVTDPDALAYHFTRSGDREKAIIYLEQAADRARDAFAGAVADARYSELIEILRSMGRLADLARVYEKLGRLRLTMVQPDAAMPSLEASADIYRQLGDVSGFAIAAARIGEVHYQRGSFEDGLRYVDDVLREIGGQLADKGALAWLWSSRASLLLVAGRYQEQLEAAERAIDAIGLESPAEPRWTPAYPPMLRGLALAYLGRTEESVRALETTLGLCADSGNLNLVGNCHFNLAMVHLQRAEFQEHVKHAEAALQAFTKLGSTTRISLATARLGAAHIAAGAWRKGQDILEQTLDALDRLDIPSERQLPAMYRHFVFLWRGILALTTGDTGKARSDLEEARRAREPTVGVMALHFLADADMLEDDPERAHARLKPLLSDCVGPYAPKLFDSRTFGRAAWALAELGDMDEAERLSLLALQRTPPGEVDFLRMDSLTNRGLVLAALQRWPEAERTLGEALQLCRDRQCELREVWVLQCWARAETRRGNLTRAQELASQAAIILRRQGADDAAKRVLKIASLSQRAGST